MVDLYDHYRMKIVVVKLGLEIQVRGALPTLGAGALHPPAHKPHRENARRGQLPAHTDVWTPGAAGLRAVCPPLPDTDAAPVDNRMRLTHRCLALPG